MATSSTAMVVSPRACQGTFSAETASLTWTRAAMTCISGFNAVQCASPNVLGQPSPIANTCRLATLSVDGSYHSCTLHRTCTPFATGACRPPPSCTACTVASPESMLHRTFAIAVQSVREIWYQRETR